MPRLILTVNDRSHEIDADPGTPLLWVLRDALGLRGTKYGCGIGACGACTVLVDGHAVRSCQTSAGAVVGKHVSTIEGASAGAATMSARHLVLRQASLAEDVAQCGYCQTGQLMSAMALLAAHPNPTDAQIDAAMAGNICRCGTYQRIRQAIHRAATDRGTAMPTDKR